MMKKFYTTGELARICHVDPTTIFRAVINKSIGAVTTPGGHFRIPCEEVEKFLKKSNIPWPDKSTATFRVLIVEDNPVELRAYQRALSREKNLTVKTTSSAYEAGLLTQSFQPDLILMDIYLDDGDGRDVARLVHSYPGLEKTHLVAITGNRDSKLAREIRDAGFDALLLKPIEPHNLRDKVNEYLK